MDIIQFGNANFKGKHLISKYNKIERLVAPPCCASIRLCDVHGDHLVDIQARAGTYAAPDSQNILERTSWPRLIKGDARSP